MSQFKVTVSTIAVGQAGSDKLLVLSELPDNKAVSAIESWVTDIYGNNVSVSTEKLNNSNEVYVNDLYHGKYHKVICL